MSHPSSRQNRMEKVENMIYDLRLLKFLFRFSMSVCCFAETLIANDLHHNHSEKEFPLMSRLKMHFPVCFLLCTSLLFPFFITDKSYAENVPGTVVHRTASASESKSAMDKSLVQAHQEVIADKSNQKTKAQSPSVTENTGTASGVASHKKGQDENEQDTLERALELLNNSQDYWVKGDIEMALELLDQAYALLLDVDGEQNISRQKDDLRLLISKRILAIYSSRQTVTNGKRSAIPLVMNADVEKEIRSFQNGEREFFIQSYQRAARYRPVILKALKKAGLPEELSWLPLVESGFKILALSRARALGLWQFIPSTGYKYGLNRDDWVDERMDVEKSTQAAIGYLKDLHEMFGDWLTVLAAYNCGEGRVLRVISRQHLNYLDRFWDLYRQLPNETARYVPRFLATLHIIKDPQKYGMVLTADTGEEQSGYSYETVKTEKSMRLQDIAARLDTPEDVLNILNAELRYRITPDREYHLKLLPDTSEKFARIVDDIPNADKPRALLASAARRTVFITHRVKRGETYASIAQRYGTTVNALMNSNRKARGKSIQAGRSLRVPVRSTRYASSKSNRASGTSASVVNYKVKKGDTLSVLAGRFNVSVNEIRESNGLKNNTLRAGQTIKINHHNNTSK